MGGFGSGPRQRAGRPADTTPAIRVGRLLAKAKGQAEAVTITRGDCVQRVRIEYTPCTYGGIGRPWFLCPSPSPDCGRRCAVLYRPEAGGLYRCRLCCGLSYQSQRERRRHRVLSKIMDIRRTLGQKDFQGIHCLRPHWGELDKPRFMHDSRYGDLVCELQELEAEYSRLLNVFFDLGPREPFSPEVLEHFRQKYGEKVTAELQECW